MVQLPGVLVDVGSLDCVALAVSTDWYCRNEKIFKVAALTR